MHSLFGTIALILLSASMARGAAISYLVTLDTSSVNGSSGFIDLQFNPGNNTSQLATAQISSFNSGGGTLVFNVNSPQTTGDVSGTLPGVVTLVNDQPVNDYFHQFTYGSFFRFVLSLTG